MMEMETGDLGGGGKATVVGITAPTKDDWSNEFELAGPGEDEVNANVDALAAVHKKISGTRGENAAAPALGGNGPEADERDNARAADADLGARTPSGTASGSSGAGNATSSSNNGPQSTTPPGGTNSRRHAGGVYGIQPLSHPRRIVRSLDWAKIHSIHQAQFMRSSTANGASSTSSASNLPVHAMRPREMSDLTPLTVHEEFHTAEKSSASLTSIAGFAADDSLFTAAPDCAERDGEASAVLSDPPGSAFATPQGPGGGGFGVSSTPSPPRADPRASRARSNSCSGPDSLRAAAAASSTASFRSVESNESATMRAQRRKQVAKGQLARMANTSQGAHGDSGRPHAASEGEEFLGGWGDAAPESEEARRGNVLHRFKNRIMLKSGLPADGCEEVQTAKSDPTSSPVRLSLEEKDLSPRANSFLSASLDGPSSADVDDSQPPSSGAASDDGLPISAHSMSNVDYKGALSENGSEVDALLGHVSFAHPSFGDPIEVASDADLDAEAWAQLARSSSKPGQSHHPITPDASDQELDGPAIGLADEDEFEDGRANDAGFASEDDALGGDDDDDGEDELNFAAVGNRDNDDGNEDDDGDDDDDDDGDRSSLSSGSDWDAELAIEADDSVDSFGPEDSQGLGPSTLGAFQQHLEGLRNLVGANNEETRGSHQLPRRWRLTTQIREESAAPTVLRYPKPTALFSLRTREGMRFMQETALEQWLAKLVSIDQVKARQAQIEQTAQIDADPKHMRKLLGKFPPGSLEWSEAYLSLVWSLYSARKDGMCAETAVRLFRMLAPFASEKKRRLTKKSFSSMEGFETSAGPSLSSSLPAADNLIHFPTVDSLASPLTPSEDHSKTTTAAKPQDASRGAASASAHRSRSVDDLEPSHSNPRRSSRELPLAPWDSFLKTVLGTFHWGTLALARSGAAHAAGDLNRARGTSRQDVPECVLSMVSETKKWVSTQVPASLRHHVDTYVMMLEAEAAAHQLATCVLDLDRRAHLGGAHAGSMGVAAHGSSVSSMSALSTASAVSASSSKTASRHLHKHMHRARRRASKESFDCAAPDADAPQAWRFAYAPPESSAAPFLSAEAQMAETVLAQLCSAYLRASSSPYENRKDFGCFPQADPLLVQAGCLCDIQLLLCGMSPLTTSETNKLQDALDQLQLELEKWMTSDPDVEREVVDIVGACAEASGAGALHPDEIGISMCIGVVHKYREAADRQMIECERLCNVDPRYRMEQLLSLYSRIPAYSLLKAKAAYVLAMYTWDEQRDSALAEEMLFECLFILEMQSNDLPQCEGAPLLSELATNAMVLYGDILVENGKYKYAIGAFESAARSYRIREHNDFQWLHRRLCSICVEHMDWDRALKYHLEILHTTKLETSLNEFVYVSERVAMMLLDQRADFAQAESYLKLALSYLGTRRSSSMDESFSPSYTSSHDGLGYSPAGLGPSSSDAHHRFLRVKLQQRLAHVLLAANRPEDAARLLERVLATLGSGNGPSGIAEVSPYLGWPSLNPSASRDHPLNDTFSAEHLQSSASRLTVLLALAKACLKVRWLADAMMALDQLAQEVTHGRWCDPSFASSHSSGLQRAAIGTFPRPQPSDGMIIELLTMLAGTSSEITMTYAIIRARCTLYQGVPTEAQAWIDETLRLAGLDPSAMHVEPTARASNPASAAILNLTLGQIGRLLFYRGKILQIAHCPNIVAQVGSVPTPYAQPRCQECGRSMPGALGGLGNSSGGNGAGGDSSAHGKAPGPAASASVGPNSPLTPGPQGFAGADGGGGGPSAGLGSKQNSTGGSSVSISNAFAEDFDHGFLERSGSFFDEGVRECIHSFWRAFEYFQLIDDALWQAKTLARIGQVELVAYAHRKERASFDGESASAILDSIEETTSMALDLCSDIGYAPLMLRALVNMTELLAFRGDRAKAWNFWRETNQLLNMLYLTTTLPSSPPNNPASPGMADSFSFSDETANAQFEVEQALSTFLKLSAEASGAPSKDAENTRPSSDSLAESTGAFDYPATRVPGIFTPPGMTYRLLEHLTRLLRLSMGTLGEMEETTSTPRPMHEPVGVQVEMLSTWNYLTDECWRQHSFVAFIMLQDHVRSPIYDDYLIMYRPAQRDARHWGVGPPQASASERNHDLRSAQTPGRTRYHGDSGGTVASAAALVANVHRRNMSDSAVPMDAAGRKERYALQAKQRERMRQLRQQLRHGDEGCKRCRNARQAELMTTEGRTNAALWSCFHRLKLLSHGEIGHTLHMNEVFSQNLDLLRSIRKLARATRAVAPAATVIFGSTKASQETSHHPRNVRLFKAPPARVDSMDGPALPAANGNYVLLCLWDAKLTVAIHRRGTSEERPLVSTHKVLADAHSSSDVGVARKAFENAISEEDRVAGFDIPVEKLSQTLLSDPQPTLLGLWDLVREIPLDHIFRLMSTLLNEQPIVVASSLCAVRARAIEALLALIRPLPWVHLVLRNIPAPVAFAMGRMFHSKTYVVGMHPSAVKNFVCGLEAAASAAEEQPVHPSVVNLDDGWVEFPARNLRRSASIPASLRSAMVAVMRGAARGDRADSGEDTAAEDSSFSDMSARRQDLPPPPVHKSQQPVRRQSVDTSGALSWGHEARRRCARLYEGAQMAMMWLVRFHAYFYEPSAKSFDGHRYYKSMLVEDPRGAFTQQFAHSQLFRLFLQQAEAAKTISRLRLDEGLGAHLSAKARLYRALVGLTRGCWVHMVVLDHTLDLDVDDFDDSSLEAAVMAAVHTPKATGGKTVSTHGSSAKTASGPGRVPSTGSGASNSTQNSANGNTSHNGTLSHRRNSATMFGNSAVTGASSGKSTGAQIAASSQWSSIFSSFGLSSHASHQNMSRVAAVSRVANDIQEMQLACEMQRAQCTARRGSPQSANSPQSAPAGFGLSSSSAAPSSASHASAQPLSHAAGFSDSSSFFQIKAKKKWIYLEEKRLRYHYRKSKNREKGGIALDPTRTRLVVPTSQYLQDDSAASCARLQATLDRTRKSKPEDAIDDPKPGCDDEHWIYLVTQLREPNKARTVKIRFLDKLEEALWVDALRVKLMNSELLLRLLETAFTSAG